MQREHDPVGSPPPFFVVVKKNKVLLRSRVGGVKEGNKPAYRAMRDTARQQQQQQQQRCHGDGCVMAMRVCVVRSGSSVIGLLILFDRFCSNCFLVFMVTCG